MRYSFKEGLNHIYPGIEFEPNRLHGLLLTTDSHLHESDIVVTINNSGKVNRTTLTTGKFCAITFQKPALYQRKNQGGETENVFVTRIIGKLRTASVIGEAVVEFSNEEGDEILETALREKIQFVLSQGDTIEQ